MNSSRREILLATTAAMAASAFPGIVHLAGATSHGGRIRGAANDQVQKLGVPQLSANDQKQLEKNISYVSDALDSGRFSEKYVQHVLDYWGKEESIETHATHCSLCYIILRKVVYNTPLEQEFEKRIAQQRKFEWGCKVRWKPGESEDILNVDDWSYLRFRHPVSGQFLDGPPIGWLHYDNGGLVAVGYKDGLVTNDVTDLLFVGYDPEIAFAA